MSTIPEILAERETTHGDFAAAARVKQRLIHAMREELAACGKSSLVPDDAALDAVLTEAAESILGKLARAIAGDPRHEDHWNDVAGYGSLAANEVWKRPPPGTSRRRRKRARA